MGAQRSKPKGLSPDDLAALAEGSSARRWSVVVRHDLLAWRAVGSIYGPREQRGSLTRDDAHQVACLGLYRATADYDERKGAWSTYAVKLAKAYIWRELATDSGLPEGVYYARRRLRAAEAALAQDLGRMPTARELAICEPADALQVQALQVERLNSLEVLANRDGERDGAEMLVADGRAEAAYEFTAGRHDAAWLVAWVRAHIRMREPERAVAILLDNAGLNVEGRPLRQTEMARKYGLSSERIRHLLCILTAQLATCGLQPDGSLTAPRGPVPGENAATIARGSMLRGAAIQ
jgi:DNA-directed RNA polymerase specialized sigma subunit